MTPKDWKEHEIGDLIELETGVSINAEDRPKRADEYGVLKVSAVSYGKFDPTAYKTINDISLCRVRITPKADSVLISRANTFELVGASVYVDKDYTDLFLPDKLWQSRRLSEELSIKWLSYALTTDRMRYEIMTRATGTSGSMKNISQESFLSIRIPVPSPSEQRKIAEILSTWDEAIDLTERLLAAKQRRKQALMQRLLTGQVRFPGFEDEWTRDKLQNIATIDYGKSPNEIRDDNGSFNIWGTGGIVGKTNVALCSSPALIIGRKGTIDKPILTESPFWTIDTTFYCLPKSGNHVRWLYYALSQTDLKQYNEASGVPSLSRNTLYHIEMQVPSIAEQGKISEVLSACDEELDLHQQKLAALRRQKQGLMQQLLTGRVRVVE